MSLNFDDVDEEDEKMFSSSSSSSSSNQDEGFLTSPSDVSRSRKSWFDEDVDDTNEPKRQKSSKNEESPLTKAERHSLKEWVEQRESLILIQEMPVPFDSGILRHHSFYEMYLYLDQMRHNQLNLCDMVTIQDDNLERKNFSKNEEKGAVGIIEHKLTSGFSLKLKDPNLKIAVKIMRNNNKSRSEINWYYMFTHYVLSGGFPHFPLVSFHQECVATTCVDASHLDKYNDENDRPCLILFSELANGTAEIGDDYFYQILMALVFLEKKNIVHADIDLGNILWHEEVLNAGKYLHYKIITKEGEKDIYVRHNGRLWFLWDFEFMLKNSENHVKHGFKITNTFDFDLQKLVNKLPSIKRKLEQSGTTTVLDFLLYLAHEDGQDHILLTSPVSAQIINQIPYRIL